MNVPTGFADNSGNVKRNPMTNKVEPEEEPAKPIENYQVFNLYIYLFQAGRWASRESAT